MYYIRLERVHKFFGVACAVLCFDELRYPFELLVDLCLRSLTRLIFPVRGNTVFGNVVHFPRSYLNLKRYAVPAYDRRMKRTVHIRFRCRNIILEASRYRTEHLVNYAENRITFKLCIDDYTKSVKIVYFVKALILIIHLAVDAVNGFYSAFKREFNIILAQFRVHLISETFNKSEVLPVLFFDMVFYLLVPERVKVFKRKIFEFLLYPLHTEAVRKRRIHLHGFERDGSSFCLAFRKKRAHIMKSVTELYEYDAHVLRHGKKHLSEVLDMRLLFIFDLKPHYLRQSVNEHRDVLTEELLYIAEVCLIGAILHRIVKKRGTDRIGIKFKSRDYLGNGDRVGYIFLAARAVLPCVKLLCIFESARYLLRVVVLSRRAEYIKEAVYIRLGSCTFYLFALIIH